MLKLIIFVIIFFGIISVAKDMIGEANDTVDKGGCGCLMAVITLLFAGGLLSYILPFPLVLLIVGGIVAIWVFGYISK